MCGVIGRLYTLAIRSEEHGGKSQIVALDDDAPHAAATAFFAALGCDDATKAKIKSAEEGGDDDKVADTGAGAVRLYHASDESGELTTEEVGLRVCVHTTRFFRFKK